MNIYQRVNKVREAVDYLIKDKKVEGYMAVTHDAVTAAVREHFIKHGVVIYPEAVIQSACKDTGTTTSRGTPFVRLEIRYRFAVVNAEDPADRFSIEIEAHALDHGDKAPGKALSYAKKYAVLKLLEIETGEEEEGRQDQHKPKNTPTQLTKDSFDGLDKKRQNMILDTVTQIVDFLIEDRDFDAYALCETIEDADEKMALWSRLDSKQRSRIKKQSDLSKKAA